MALTRSRIGAYSRRGVLAKIDGRSREALLMREVRRQLVEHVGGAPSVTQKMLIDRAAWLSLHLALLDEKAIGSAGFTDHDHRTYLAWSSALSRLLRDLGMAAVRPKAPTLDELKASVVARKSAA